LFGILFLGGFIYSLEIPNYLIWLRNKFYQNNFYAKILSALLFTLYFNPLWIARHLLILNLFQGNFNQINWNLLRIGFSSFVYSFFFTLPVNYLIINQIQKKWKFAATAVFSSSMAVFYALSEVIFK
jgi:hypothetical protein